MLKFDINSKMLNQLEASYQFVSENIWNVLKIWYNADEEVLLTKGQQTQMSSRQSHFAQESPMVSKDEKLLSHKVIH